MNRESDYIYLDNHATTPIASQVVEAMLPFFYTHFGNASSDSILGETARKAISYSRESIASLMGANSDEIFYTSGATESLNWGIKGLCTAKSNKKHIITSSIEHSSILKVCDYLELVGYSITRINPDTNGILSIELINNAIRTDTLCIAIAHANNEIGTIQPIEAIGKLCKERDIYFIVDAAQTFGKIKIDVKKMGIHLLAVSGHKLYAPKGIGCLFIDKIAQKKIVPLISGGGQEFGFRSGTENVPYIVGLGKAAEICLSVMEQEQVNILNMRQKLLENLQKGLDKIVINGCLENRLAANLNISFIGVPSDVFIKNIGNIIVAKGSACTSLRKSYSHVLQAISNQEDIMSSAIRIGIGRYNTMEEIEYVSNKIINTVNTIIKSNGDF